MKLSRLAILLTSVAAGLALSAPATAQEKPWTPREGAPLQPPPGNIPSKEFEKDLDKINMQQTYLNWVDISFEGAERERLAGNCIKRSDHSSWLIAIPYSPDIWNLFTPEDQARFRKRYAEMMEKPCPPPGVAEVRDLDIVPPAPPPLPTQAELDAATQFDSPPESEQVSDFPPTGPLGPELRPSPPAPPPPDPTDTKGASPREVSERVDGWLKRAAEYRGNGNCVAWRQAIQSARAEAQLVSGRLLADNLETTARLRLQYEAESLAVRIDDEARRECGSAQAGEREFAARLALGLSGGLGESTVPSGNFGFMRDGPPPAPENPALLSERRIAVRVFEAEARFNEIGRFRLGYREGDAREAGDFPIGPVGTARGYPYTRVSPSGSSGVTGNVPFHIGNFVELEEFSGSFEREVFGGDDDVATVGREREVVTNLSLGAQFIHRQLGIDTSVSITTPVIALQTLEQDVRSLEIGPYVAGETIFPIANSVQFTLGGQVGAYFYDFDLKSLETISQNFGPTADRSFVSMVEGGKTGVGIRAQTRAELAVAILRNLQLFLAGDAAYSSVRAGIRNPLNGDAIIAGETTGLRRGDAFDWSVILGVRFALGL